MTRSRPFVSVVIPTRNRPDMVGYAMQSLSRQSFRDFEVIVCDNHTGQPCKSVFDELADERFRYIAPPVPLSMHDNWEFACDAAEGDFVTVLIDKTVLRPSALEILYKAVETHPAEVYSWWAEVYRPDDEQRSNNGGRYIPLDAPVASPSYFDPVAELRRRYGLDVRRGTEGVRYFWGKICFGAYHRDLIRRIKQGAGRLFHAINPDYTSMLAALAHTAKAVDVGEPLLIQFRSVRSNGARCAVHPEVSLRFLTDTDPSLVLLDTLPVPGLYSSQHNVVAHDYVLMKNVLGKAFPDVQLEIGNLLLRIREDLRGVQWPSKEERDRHRTIYRQYLGRAPVRAKTVFYLNYWMPRLQAVARINRATLARAMRAPFARFPRIKKGVKQTIVSVPALRAVVQRVLGYDIGLSSAPKSPPGTFCDTILAAADRADRRYGVGGTPRATSKV